VNLASQETLAYPEKLDHQAKMVLMEKKEALDHQDHQDHQVSPDQEGKQDSMEVLDLQDPKGSM